jgi:hypothetical protein
MRKALRRLLASSDIRVEEHGAVSFVTEVIGWLHSTSEAHGRII